MRWFEEDFSKDVARDFLRECWNFTSEYVLNHARELVPTWPLTNIMPKNVFQFEPDGAVVHISESPSMWNTLRLQTGHVFASHFIVMTGKHASVFNQYPLLNELPSTVFMLYPFDVMIPHAGFLSAKTLGIELRNAGRLRPVPYGTEPLPLMPSEENDRHFTITNTQDYDYYWRQDLWRHKFAGPVGHLGEYAYELPSRAQIISTLALLRTIECLLGDEDTYGLDRRMIVPSNCVSAQHTKLPFIDWDAMRELTLRRGEIPTQDWMTIFPTRTNTDFEWYDLHNDDESLIAEQFDLLRWRGERDDGQLTTLNEDREFKLATGYKRALGAEGYDTTDLNFSLNLWAIANGIGGNTDEIIYNKLNQSSEFKGINSR